MGFNSGFKGLNPENTEMIRSLWNVGASIGTVKKIFGLGNSEDPLPRSQAR